MLFDNNRKIKILSSFVSNKLVLIHLILNVISFKRFYDSKGKI
jgi:hypothetical protein